MPQRLPMTGPITAEVIDEVPDKDLGRVAEDFRDSGAVEVKAEPNADGTWKVTATFPG
jgi:hypothetical protein